MKKMGMLKSMLRWRHEWLSAYPNLWELACLRIGRDSLRKFQRLIHCLRRQASSHSLCQVQISLTSTARQCPTNPEHCSAATQWPPECA
jgi:hypothetical protein